MTESYIHNLFAERIGGKKFGKDTEAFKHYSAGRLPPARIHLRATRYAVKAFLSALHEIWYFHEYGTLPPLPYPIAHLGHAHLRGVPNGHLIEGYMEARGAHAK